MSSYSLMVSRQQSRWLKGIADNADTWRENASCVGKTPDRFFYPEAERGNDPVLVSLCETCPVKEKCLADEMQTTQNVQAIHGYRAGLTKDERRNLFRRIKRLEKEENK